MPIKSTQSLTKHLYIISSLCFPVIDIRANLNELNPKYSVIQFYPADSIFYNTYQIQATAATGSSTDCNNYASDFHVDLNIDCPCQTYFVHKPATCDIQYAITACNNSETVSDTITIRADDGKT